MTNEKNKISILVLDDDTFILKTIEHILHHNDFKNTTMASSVEIATTHLKDPDSINIILMDLNMPTTDGIEFFRILEDKNYKGGVILISGEDAQTIALAKNLAQVRKLNILGTIAKPISPNKLISLLNTWAPFDTTHSKVISSSSSLTKADLQSAIEKEELEPWFQPVINMQTSEFVGVEMLARWPRAKGNVYPDEFIPLAEENNLITQLTFMLLKKSAIWIKRWTDEGYHLSLAINISMNSLHQLDFSDELIKVISDTGLSIEQLPLTIEVTESSLAEDLSTPLDNLLRLRMKKIGLSIDDFGTGWSNLTQLHELPFTELKLDLSFVQGASVNERTRAILESTVKMAEQLRMTTVAEGIETMQEWTYLKGLGCNLAQGYFMARPMPGGDILNWASNWKNPE